MELVDILKLALPMIGAGLGLYATYIAQKTRAEFLTMRNSDDIKTLIKRLDGMDSSDVILVKGVDEVRARLIGLSGDNGLVHDIVRLKNQVETLNTSLAVVADRVGVIIKKAD